MVCKTILHTGKYLPIISFRIFFVPSQCCSYILYNTFIYNSHPHLECKSFDTNLLCEKSKCHGGKTANFSNNPTRLCSLVRFCDLMQKCDASKMIFHFDIIWMTKGYALFTFLEQKTRSKVFST